MVGIIQSNRTAGVPIAQYYLKASPMNKQTYELI